ncbi:MAG: EamA family transporter [Bacteroidota bacterium]|jgi:uncharacterized membrane protein
MLFLLTRIASLFFFFVSDLLWVKPLKEGIPQYTLIFYRAIFTVILFSLIYIGLSVWGHDFAVGFGLIKAEYPTNAGIYILAIVLSLSGFWGLYFFTMALKSNKFSLIAPLANLGFVFSITTAMLYYRQPISLPQFAAFVCFAATVLLIIQKMGTQQLKLFIIPVILTQFFWDTAVVFHPIVIKAIGIIPFCLLTEVVVLLSALVLMLYNRKNINWNALRELLPRLILMAFMICSAVFLLALSLANLPVVVVLLLGLFTKVIRLLYGYIALNERLDKTELLLLLLMVIGGVLASISIN